MLGIVQGKTTVAKASRACDLPPSEIEKWDGDRTAAADSLVN